MQIVVVDGQGGGIGKALVEKLKQVFKTDVYITALGTNALATALMLKAGADDGATGENAVIVNVQRADIIMGPIGIMSANALLGELTPLMAKAIGESQAKKILIPVNRCSIAVAGVENKPLPAYVDDAINLVKSIITI